MASPSGIIGDWNWRRSVAESALPATTRHVLLTLSLHVSDAGEGAFPSLGTLVRQTGLTEATVKKHLREAIDAGWVQKEERFTERGRQTSNRYYLTAPLREGDRKLPPGNEVTPGRGIADTPLTTLKGLEGTATDLLSSEIAEQPELLVPLSAPPSPTLLAVASLCTAAGCTWRLRTASMREWCHRLESDPKYARLDIPDEVMRCQEWHDSKRRKMTDPARAVRNWLDRALEMGREKPNGNGKHRDPDDKFYR